MTLTTTIERVRGGTVLISASWGGDAELVLALLERRADMKWQSWPLHAEATLPLSRMFST